MTQGEGGLASRGEHLASSLRDRFRGALITSTDTRYDAARALYNGMIDKRPALIAQCATIADVVAAVEVARTQGVLLAVRSGGHNGPGLGSCDDGLVIDLRRLNAVDVNTESRQVSVGAGCLLQDLDAETYSHGLAVPAGIFGSTGIGGLTLGGGHGYLTRAHGLSIDNLLETDVVLADGRCVTANATSHPDLFWALRGGGGNFGVVTRFTFRAHPVSSVFGGWVLWRLEDAREVMRAYRDFLPHAPLALCPFLGLKSVPSHAGFPPEFWGKKVCAIISCHVGTANEGLAALLPLLEGTPDPIFSSLSEISFPEMQTTFDPLLPCGMQWYWKGDFVETLTDEAIDVHLNWFAAAAGDHSFMHLYPIDGAVHQVGQGATAWSARTATWSMVIAGIDSDPSHAPALRDWGRRYWQAVHPFNLSGAYINFMDADEGFSRTRASYGENFNRLAEIKRRYDPENLFRVNQNIAPVGTNELRDPKQRLSAPREKME